MTLFVLGTVREFLYVMKEFNTNTNLSKYWTNIHLTHFTFQQIKVNGDARVEDQSRDPDPFGDHLVFVMMQHLQRQRVSWERFHSGHLTQEFG